MKPLFPRVVRVLIALALLLPACSSGDEEVGLDVADGISPLFEVRQMLRSRAAALSRGDTKDYLNNVAPQAQASEEAIAKGGASVPLTRVNFIFNPSSRVSLSSEVFKDVETRLSYRYEGLPTDNEFSFNLVYSVQKVRGEWKVTQSQVDPEPSRVPDWVRAPMMHKVSKDFLAIYRPGLPLLDESLEAMGEAKRNLVKKLSLPFDERQVVFLAKDRVEYASMTGRPDNPSIAQATYLSSGSGIAIARQMAADLEALFPSPETTALEHGESIPASQVFQHELGHLALSRFAGDVTPRWVVEGAAMYLAGERRTVGWKRMQDEGLLDADQSKILTGEIVGDFVTESPYLYTHANAATSYLIETYGANKFWDFYKRFRRVQVEATSREEAEIEAAEAVLFRAYGIGTSRLDEHARAWIKEQLAAA